MNLIKIITLALVFICSFGCATTNVKYSGERDFATGDCLPQSSNSCATWEITQVIASPTQPVWLVILGKDGVNSGSGRLDRAALDCILTAINGIGEKAGKDPESLVGVRVTTKEARGDHVFDRFLEDARRVCKTLIQAEVDTLSEAP